MEPKTNSMISEIIKRLKSFSPEKVRIAYFFIMNL